MRIAKLKNRTSTLCVVASGILAMFLVVGCSQASPSPAAPVPTPTIAPPPTATPAPTATPIPTPTVTPQPTSVPPTATPADADAAKSSSEPTGAETLCQHIGEFKAMADDGQELKDAAEVFIKIATDPEVLALLDPEMDSAATVLITATQKYVDNPEGLTARLVAEGVTVALDAAAEKCVEAGYLDGS